MRLSKIVGAAVWCVTSHLGKICSMGNFLVRQVVRLEIQGNIFCSPIMNIGNSPVHCVGDYKVRLLKTDTLVLPNIAFVFHQEILRK